MIYLDNNATTRVPPEVIDVMTRHWSEAFANPGSRHAAGRKARQVLEASRESIAALLGAEPDEVVFTSGGTESNNMAVLGFTAGTPGVIALTGGDHPAVVETCRYRVSQGWKLETLPLDNAGRLVARLTERLADDAPSHRVRLATTILAHNETGVIQDVSALAADCQARLIPLHLDAVQAVGKIDVNFHSLGAATLAFGAHKFHGPRGIGGLLVRRGWKLTPSLYGGHQETGLRPGTEAIPLIAGMARALELFASEREHRQSHLRELRDRFEARLSALCPPVVVNGGAAARLPNTSNIAFPGIEGEPLLVTLDLEGIACSMGSTCASGSAEPSPILLAMGQPPEVWRSSMRFSLGRETTAEEIEQAAQIIARAVTRLRGTP